jgi:hypothetical protein
LRLKGDDIGIFVLCQMQEDQNQDLVLLEEGDHVRVKGILKGFLKDAIMLNCIIIKESNE